MCLFLRFHGQRQQTLPRQHLDSLSHLWQGKCQPEFFFDVKYGLRYYIQLHCNKLLTLYRSFLFTFFMVLINVDTICSSSHQDKGYAIANMPELARVHNSFARYLLDWIVSLLLYLTYTCNHTAYHFSYFQATLVINVFFSIRVSEQI